MSKAVLTFPVRTATTGVTSYEITVIRYSAGYQSQLSNSTTRTTKHGYPIRTKEQDISITIQCRSVAEYDAINKTIGIAQTLMLLNPNSGYIRFTYPEINLDYLGFIAQTPTGVARFVAAPQLSFTMSLFRDTINTITGQYSSANGTWKDIAGENLVDLPNKPVDRILYNLQPRTTGVSSGGGRRAV